MFRYTVELDVSFSGQKPTIQHDDAADMPLGGRITVTLGSPIDTSGPGGSMHLPTGVQITGTIIGKHALP